MESFKPTQEKAKEDIVNPELGYESPRLLERLRARTPESIEKIDINQDGLAIHGTQLDKLEDVLKNGLGHYHGKNICGVTWFNVVGTRATERDDLKDAKIGFGNGRVRFGGEITIVNDVFRELWPNTMNSIAKLRDAGTGVAGEVKIKVERDSVYMEFDWNEIDLNDIEELPEPGELLIPGFEKEELWISSSSNGKKQVAAGTTHNRSDQLAWRQLLGRAALSAIVISDHAHGKPLNEEEAEKFIEEIVAIQQKLRIPKEEQIPVFNEAGKCLYNPLKSNS